MTEQLDERVREACKWIRQAQSAVGHVEHFLSQALPLTKKAEEEAQAETNAVYENDQEKTADLNALADREAYAKRTGELCREAIQVMKSIQKQLDEMELPED